MAKKRVKKEEHVEITWSDRFEKSRSTIFLILSVVTVLVASSLWHLAGLQEKSTKSWGLIGSVTNAMVDQVDPDLKIRDLSPEVKKLVRQSIKDKSALPESVRGNVGTLDDLALKDLPPFLRKSVLNKHYLKELEAELPQAKDTTAEPWIKYCMANLNFAEGDNQKTFDIYNEIGRDYPYHLLFGEVNKYINFHGKQLMNPTANVPKNLPKVQLLLSEGDGKTKAVIKTNKGNFSINIAQSDSKIGQHFSSLVRSGFYNGLMFYGQSQKELRTGCTMATGLGGTTYKSTAEKTEEGYMQRGLVILEHDNNSLEVGSRLSNSQTILFGRK